MIAPQYGKVVIIEDKISEALPLMNILSNENIPFMYFDGTESNFPSELLVGIRMIFLDLRFDAITPSDEGKNVYSRISNIFGNLLSNENGPYILLVWSKHQDDYESELKDKLKSINIEPEFILFLDKAEYFDSQYDIEHKFREFTLKEINYKYGNDFGNEVLVDKLTYRLKEIGCFDQKKAKSNALKEIEKKLKEELQKADLMSLFILWENAVGKAKTETINQLYYNMPDNIKKENRLKGLLYYLAYNGLEKSFDIAKNKTRIYSAIKTLNELFYYFNIEESQTLAENPDLKKIRVEENLNFKRDSKSEKYNTWLLTKNTIDDNDSGRIYLDSKKTFKPHGLIDSKNYHEKYFCRYKSIEYILIDISADCNLAQLKDYTHNIVYGILIPEELFKKLIDKKRINGKYVIFNENTLRFKNKSNNSSPEYLIDFGAIETKYGVCRLIFNLNMASFCSKDELNRYNLLFSLRKSSVVHLQTELGKYIAKQGKSNF